MTRLLASFLAILMLLGAPAAAQSVVPPEGAVNVTPDGQPAGAAPDPISSLDDILRRQQGLPVDDSARRAAVGDPDSAAGIASQLGTLGGPSDSEVWRALRFGDDDVTVSTNQAVDRVLMQDGGMRWQYLRDGPLREYGGWLLVGVIAALAVFFVLRGRIPIDGGRLGRTVLRFKFYERLAHWTLAVSFIALGLTGLASLFGRIAILPLLGPEANASILLASKWIHNNVAWPFMIALVAIFLMWVWHNLPSRTDLVWIAKGGGIVGNAHPPAKKFNFGQKMIFWSVIVLGGSLSASGLALLFPFELPMFAGTFAKLNEWGITGLLGLDPLPTEMAPHEEMQYAQLWHAIVGFVLMAIALAHIYIGSLGMEGAYDAMGSGEVDVAWAEQHHSLWLEEVREKELAEAPPPPPSKAHPAE